PPRGPGLCRPRRGRSGALRAHRRRRAARGGPHASRSGRAPPRVAGVSVAPLAPWLARARDELLRQRGHAWLLHGPSGLGQYELGLVLAAAWLCEQPTPHGACGHCPSCHAIAVRTHARSEEHTSELQSRENLVCRLLLE